MGIFKGYRREKKRFFLIGNIFLEGESLKKAFFIKAILN